MRHLCYVGALLVNGLHLVWGHVLAPRQFEDQLLVVDDLQGPIGLPLAHVPGVQPALGVHHRPRPVGVPEVALEPGLLDFCRTGFNRLGDTGLNRQVSAGRNSKKLACQFNQPSMQCNVRFFYFRQFLLV